MRVGDRNDTGHRNHRLDGIASGGQNVTAGLCGQKMGSGHGGRTKDGGESGIRFLQIFMTRQLRRLAKSYSGLQHQPSCFARGFSRWPARP